jgi:hypothetical protein
LAGPEQAKVQLFQDEVPAAEPVDLFRPSPARSGRRGLGVLNLEAGENPIMLKLVGKHEEATALGLDLIELVLHREP